VFVARDSELTSRVINTIRNLLDIHYLEDQDASMLDRVEQFINALHAEGATTMATQLSNLVTRRVSPPHSQHNHEKTGRRHRD